MSMRTRSRVGSVAGALLVSTLAVGASFAGSRQASPAAQPQEPVFTVDGQVALHAFMSLSDGYLQSVAHELALVASTDAVRSGAWERVREPLAEMAHMGVPSVLFFARPDGAYWTVDHGLERQRVSDRHYFTHVMAGETVIGDLIVSRATHRNSAVVAVPVRGSDDRVVGLVGSSIDLQAMSERIRQELGGLDDNHVFFAIDADPLGALHSDPNLIFTEPMRLGDPGMRQAFREILAHREGVVSYDFQGRHRTVLYARSAVSGWWYGFGVLR